jgi:hypothetical protein
MNLSDAHIFHFHADFIMHVSSGSFVVTIKPWTNIDIMQ